MPCVADLADDLDHLVDLDMVQPGHDLVAQQQLRLHGQRLGEFQPLAARAAELVGALVDDLPSPTKSRCARAFSRASARLGRPFAVSEQRADRDIVEHRQAGEGPHDLEGAADAEPRAAEGGQRAMDLPSNRISPELGASVPLIRLTSVVLPAPFGPMTPRISPCCSVKQTSLTAISPAKRRVT